MEEITLTGQLGAPDANGPSIYCPSLFGLTVTQADLAIVMPRIDHNQRLREAPCQGRWAAILACDPFGSERALFRDLRELGYKGVINWPSTILLDGELRESMATIPASPEHEYSVLARAAASGLETLAVFRSLDQARAAIDAGLKRLVLHPGLIASDVAFNGNMVVAALERLIENLRAQTPGLALYAYTSDWHDGAFGLDALPVDGVIRLQVET